MQTCLLHQPWRHTVQPSEIIVKTLMCLWFVLASASNNVFCIFLGSLRKSDSLKKMEFLNLTSEEYKIKRTQNRNEH